MLLKSTTKNLMELKARQAKFDVEIMKMQEEAEHEKHEEEEWVEQKKRDIQKKHKEEETDGGQ